jgi:hypothetical protein
MSRPDGRVCLFVEIEGSKFMTGSADGDQSARWPMRRENAKGINSSHFGLEPEKQSGA